MKAAFFNIEQVVLWVNTEKCEVCLPMCGCIWLDISSDRERNVAGADWFRFSQTNPTLSVRKPQATSLADGFCRGQTTVKFLLPAWIEKLSEAKYIIHLKLGNFKKSIFVLLSTVCNLRCHVPVNEHISI